MTGDPVRGWGEAAAVLKRSRDTLERHRKRFGDTTRVPWWPDAEAVKAWYQALIAPTPVPPPAKRRTRRAEPEVFDANRIRIELAGGGR